MAQAEKSTRGLAPNTHTRTSSTDHRTNWLWRRLFGGKGDDGVNNGGANATAVENGNANGAAERMASPQEDTQKSGLARRLSKKVVPGLPRTKTFKRQQSERRDRLELTDSRLEERRTVSVDRRHGTLSRPSSPVLAGPRSSAPELCEKKDDIDAIPDRVKDHTASSQQDGPQKDGDIPRKPSNIGTQSISTEAFDEMILDELEKRWILNLSMHFRDKSKREKFFVTYAETPTHWRRVTVSLDYRNAAAGSLEEELQRTRFQRDKSARIYEAIRESLQDIQFYVTVTNLKLQTENERLHVHVVEDVSEIIAYPPVRAIGHLDCPRVREEELVFDSHLSGFVYKVDVHGQVFIKKEIPGPDTVDEFLYEINALHQLSGSRSVIQFGGVVVDNKGEFVKGLLISFAEQGALIDVLYDGEGDISWKRRERWARQVVQGLSEIHEAGFVQGDFTLSNIVIDEHENAKIIDINRRGCPVGWEPPEVAALLESGQRISMYIGVKSDLYQLGMVLYALATQEDEPEAHRPLDLRKFKSEVPDYYYEVCRRCLSVDPRARTSAYALLALFPDSGADDFHSLGGPEPIIVDVMPADEEAFSIAIPDRDHLDPLRFPRPPRFGGSSRSRSASRSYTMTETSDDLSDYPRRGRSPPLPRYEVIKTETTLPSRTMSEYLGNLTGETLAGDEHEKLSLDDYDQWGTSKYTLPAAEIPLPPSTDSKASLIPENQSATEIDHPESPQTAFKVSQFPSTNVEQDRIDVPLSSTNYAEPASNIDSRPTSQAAPIPAGIPTSIPTEIPHGSSPPTITRTSTPPSNTSNRPPLRERTSNNLRPSPSSRDLSSLPLKAVVISAPTTTTTAATIATASHPSDSDRQQSLRSKRSKLSQRSHSHTPTDTPFTPFTPNIGVFASSGPAAGRSESEQQGPVNGANTDNRAGEGKPGREDDLVGVGTHLDLPSILPAVSDKEVLVFEADDPDDTARERELEGLGLGLGITGMHPTTGLQTTREARQGGEMMI